ncbi:MAG TPA: T9SS type A sorting domain-containing protein [Bacteroidales bacterium]|nr:T9SS type A sorting domain-containing protein [Bacteroidales bacterium]
MKRSILICLTVLLLPFFCHVATRAQMRPSMGPHAPLKSGGPGIAGGTDVIIHDDATQNQRQACLDISTSGVMYAVYTVDQGSNMRWEIRRSVNQGADWYLQNYTTLGTNWYIVAIDLLVTETAAEGIRLYIATVAQNDISGYSELTLKKYDMNGSVISQLYHVTVTLPETFNDVSLASDFMNPATGASPYSMGLVYTKYSLAMDSVIFMSSSNGGTSLDGKTILEYTSNFTRNVSLAYGRCHTFSDGGYYAAWEERLGFDNDIGQIWSSHSYPFFSSAFTTPERMDNMIGASDSYCRNPVVACQNNDLDNSSGNLTEIILFDRAYNGDINNFDQVGLFNTEAVNTLNWSITSVDGNVSINAVEPDMKFFSSDNYFFTTYFYNESGNQKLRCLAQDMNMLLPYNWIVVSDRYNDDMNLSLPYPKLGYDPIRNDVAFVWNAEGSGGKGIAMYDASDITVGINPPASSGMILTAFPNPASGVTQLTFELQKQERVQIAVFTVYGELVKAVPDKDLPAGIQRIPVTVSDLPQGTYFYRVTAGSESGCGKLVVL